MKILQLIDSMNAGGAERMAVNISNVLAENGHSVVLCASRGGGSLEAFIDNKVIYSQLNKKSGLDLGAFNRLLKLIRHNGIELIHAHSSSVFWAVAAKLFVPGLKVIWHDHLGRRIEEDKFNRIIFIIISFLIDGVIAVNDELKNWSCKKLLVKKEKIVFINNFPLLSPRKVENYKTDNELLIVCLANLRPQKDHFTLINAIDYLVQNHKVKNLIVTLAGMYYQDEYYQKVLTLIHEKQLEAYVKIAGSVADNATLLYQSDIGVLSSVSEGLPVSLLEYGLAGLPVVVTNVGQCVEVLDYGNAGIIVPPSDPEALAEALLDLIRHSEKRKMLGVKLKERVVTEYGEKKFLTEYFDLIKGIV